MSALARVSDAELLNAAGPGATLEHVDQKPGFGTPGWFAWMDRRYPAKPDEWFSRARRARERREREGSNR
jgi:hypothetical protein